MFCGDLFCFVFVVSPGGVVAVFAVVGGKRRKELAVLPCGLIGWVSVASNMTVPVPVPVHSHSPAQISEQRLNLSRS